MISDSSYSQANPKPLTHLWHLVLSRSSSTDPAGFLLTTMLASGGAEMVVVGLPFWLCWLHPKSFGIILWSSHLRLGLVLLSRNSFFTAALAFALAAVIAAAVRLLNLWLNNRLVATIGSICLTYLRTLYQPYAVHVRRNSSTVVNTITNQVARVVVALNSFCQWSHRCWLQYFCLLVYCLLIGKWL